MKYPTPNWCEADAVGMMDQCCGAPGHCHDPKPEQVLEDLATLDKDLRAEVLNGLMQSGRNRSASKAYRLATLTDCINSQNGGLHCLHYQEGDGPCCHCRRPNWCPDEGVV